MDWIAVQLFGSCRIEFQPPAGNVDITERLHEYVPFELIHYGFNRSVPFQHRAADGVYDLIRILMLLETAEHTAVQHKFQDHVSNLHNMVEILSRVSYRANGSSSLARDISAL